jgi:hypothetical protein
MREEKDRLRERRRLREERRREKRGDGLREREVYQLYYSEF